MLPSALRHIPVSGTIHRMFFDPKAKMLWFGVSRRAVAAVAMLCATVALVRGFGPMAEATADAGTVNVSRDGAVLRYADGAPPGFSGGFSEQSCHACHFHADVNSGAGRVTIAGVPERFVAGQSYRLTVTLTRPGMTLGGFQLTARFTAAGAQAGTLAPALDEDTRVGIVEQGNVQYAGQRQAGAELVAPNTARWTLVWTAPTTTAPVAFHVAANAADGDERVEGDYIHTAVAETSPTPRLVTAGSRQQLHTR